MLAVWAQLVSLAGSKLEKQRMKKSLSRGLTGADLIALHVTEINKQTIFKKNHRLCLQQHVL